MPNPVDETLSPFRDGSKVIFPRGVKDDPNSMSAATAANAIATVTFAADTNSPTQPNFNTTVSGSPGNARPRYISQLIWSYKGSSTPVGNILVQAGGTPNTYLDIDINVGGHGNLLFDPPLCVETGGLTVTLGAGGAGVTGKVKVVAWRLD